MAEVVFTKDLAEATCKTLNKHKDRGLKFTGGGASEASIYNVDGSIAIDYIPQRKKFYLEIEKEVACNSCGRAVMYFDSENLEDLLIVVKTFDS